MPPKPEASSRQQDAQLAGQNTQVSKRCSSNGKTRHGSTARPRGRAEHGARHQARSKQSGRRACEPAAGPSPALLEVLAMASAAATSVVATATVGARLAPAAAAGAGGGPAERRAEVRMTAA